MKQDRNGYVPSVIQDGEFCYLCGCTTRKLDRHEVFGGANREKSKAYGLWVLLCHRPCHLDEAHKNRWTRERLQSAAQQAAMKQYGWSVEDFIRVFGKNNL